MHCMTAYGCSTGSTLEARMPRVLCGKGGLGGTGGRQYTDMRTNVNMCFDLRPKYTPNTTHSRVQPAHAYHQPCKCPPDCVKGSQFGLNQAERQHSIARAAALKPIVTHDDDDNDDDGDHAAAAAADDVGKLVGYKYAGEGGKLTHAYKTHVQLLETVVWSGECASVFG